MFLQYLYTDELEDPVDEMQILYLLRPAKKYLVPHLVTLCSETLMTELHSDNVFEVHNYAVFFDLKTLEGACLRYVYELENTKIIHVHALLVLISFSSWFQIY